MKKNLIALFLFSTILSASDIVPAGYTKVKELGGITEYRMDSNGLTVLLMEEHSAPVLTFMVTYRVGSRNEVTGTTGATHILEHLMFKGTEKYNKANGGHIDAKLGNIGAMLNATTWLDRTNYYESIPSDYLELAIDIEADRMRNLFLHEEDKDAEMTVVRNEFERGENSPFSALNKAIWAAAFQAHPYHHSTIGWRSDIENVPIEKLRDFYNTFYWPNNATVTVIGDFLVENALSLIQKYYGAIPSSPHEIPKLYTVEPEQQGPVRVEVNRAGQLGVVGIGHKVPEAKSADSYALSILNYILSEGKTSRLYKSLIDQNLAVNIFNFYFPFHDPSLFVNYAFLAPGVEHSKVEEVLLAELEKIKTEGVTQEEVTRSINQIAAETAYDRDGSFSVASQINEAIAAGDWTMFVTYLENIKKVTPDDVKNVTIKYFTTNSRTTGYFIPKVPGGGNSQAKSAPRVEDAMMNFYRGENDHPSNVNSTASNLVDPKDTKVSEIIKDQNIAGIRVLTAKTGVQDVVTFRGSFAAGDNLSPERNSMIADLTGGMLDKGTTKNGKFELAEKLENMGASINFSVSGHSTTFNGQCLNENLNEVISLLAEQLRYPAFSEEELEKLKTLRQGGLKQLLENTSTMAEEKMSELIFPKGHPNHAISVSKLIEDAAKVTIEDVKEFHKKHYGTASIIFVAVGDLNYDKVNKSIEKYFSGWKGGIEYPVYDNAALTSKGKTEIVSMEEKTSATLRIGQITNLKRTDPDFLAFDLGNQAFGGGSFTARLLSIIRDDEGLTYGIFAAHDNDIHSDGQWYISGTFSPDLLHKGFSSTMRELNRWVSEGISQKELDDTKSRLIGSFKVRLATTSGLASQIHSFAERGYSPDYIDKYPKFLEAISLKEVNEAIKKYVNPENVVTVVAGTVTESDLKAKE
ncbi:MAG: insulinase family protein [Bacteroidetes bacterium]|nr:insulinase family protein [Bacteroidota bacterium]MBU2507373.1 insulinase family protein [Bacteroidota bacterium]